MIIFMLTCIPLVYALAIGGATNSTNRSRTVRNPLIIGALAYGGFLVLQMFLQFAGGTVLAPDYQMEPAIRYFAMDALLWPFSYATLVFCLCFHKMLAEDRNLLLPAFRSFLAAFLFLLSIQDLIMALSFLSPVDLWVLPIARSIWFITLSFLLAEWRSPRKLLLILLGLFAAVQALTSIGLALAWLSQLVPAAICLAIPLGVSCALLLLPDRVISGRLHPAV